MKYGILMHEAGDDVGVAVVDLVAGSEVGAATLEGQSAGSIIVTQDIPLGHKIAVHDLAPGQRVIEYGRAIGCAIQAIACGDHVHVHNIRTLRW
jgi:(2R)-sulfolactate sulfo-lyase subunit alpha